VQVIYLNLKHVTPLGVLSTALVNFGL
jgi:hypothetical protein